jgi:hypothetical protein
MASRPTESVPIAGRVDGQGRLVSADPALERLQVEAGSAIGRPACLAATGGTVPRSSLAWRHAVTQRRCR